MGMNKFQYTALTEAGQKITGALEADSEAAALRLLEERNLFPVAVQSRGTGTGQARPRRRVRSSDIGIMYGQMADLIGSGVPLLRAFDSLIKSAASPALAIRCIR